MGCYMVRECNGGGEVGPGDIVCLPEYSFRSESSLERMLARYCNSDGEVGRGDVVYLTDCLYKDGPPSCEP